MRPNQYLQANASLNNPRIPRRTAEEEEEEESMRRIFDLVPRRKRSILRRKEDPPDFSKVPRRKRTVYTYSTTPKWLLRLMSDMKIVDDPVLLIEKTLDVDDVDPAQNRLSIPFGSLYLNKFLTCDEWKILGNETINNNGRMGVGAFLVDQRTKQWNVVFKKWTSLSCFVLSGEWSHVIEANGLRDDDNISLWSFRRHEILFFALDFAGDSIDFLE